MQHIKAHQKFSQKKAKGLNISMLKTCKLNWFSDIFLNHYKALPMLTILLQDTTFSNLKLVQIFNDFVIHTGSYNSSFKPTDLSHLTPNDDLYVTEIVTLEKNPVKITEKPEFIFFACKILVSYQKIKGVLKIFYFSSSFADLLS